MSVLLICGGVLAIVLAVAGYLRPSDWRTASREPVGLAPDPVKAPEALVQIYAARALGWRGLFGVHTWIAVKPAGEGYTVWRGAAAAALIERIERAARTYPWSGEYQVWPGPNSNTFTAWVLRSIPELQADLPPTAIGKDYTGGRLFTTAPSGSGVQFSVYGLLGVTASTVEGLEVNLLGLTFGVHPLDPAVKLPVIGRLGAARAFLN
jgi:hypothetical protein